jgi:glycosyltransferase involved in cell wall biosynthesis
MSDQAEVKPVVTAALICYNHARFVEAALESIEAQAYSNLHLVIVDDCSTDGSANIIRHWLREHWPSAVLVSHETNHGVCRSCNDALAHSKGKYIRFLSADDLWLPGSLSRQVEFMEELPEEVGVLYSDAYKIDESGESLPGLFIEAQRSLPGIPEGSLFDTLIEGNFIPAMTALIRRGCFERVGGYDETLAFEDWDMWLRLSHRYGFRYLPEPTAKYRVVTTSMMHTRTAEMRASGNRIYVKCLRHGWLTGQTREYAMCLEEVEAMRAYREKRPNRVMEAAWTLRHRRCIKCVLLLLFVTVGVPYVRFQRLLGVARSVRKTAGSVGPD